MNITLRIPRNSYAPSSVIDRLRVICEANEIDYRADMLHNYQVTFAPLDIIAEAPDREGLARLLDVFKQWAAALNKTVSVRFTFQVGALLIDTTEPVAGRGQTIGLMSDAADALDILDGAGVAASVSRILLDPRERIEATADVGLRTGYIIDLTNRSVRVAGGAGSVPEPAA